MSLAIFFASPCGLAALSSIPVLGPFVLLVLLERG
jgi:hypothetical protein